MSIPEEIFVVSGRLYDAAFDIWLEPGHYASRPPGEIHGPFKADGDVIILEMSCPSQSIIKIWLAERLEQSASNQSPAKNSR